jgi:hypothetical protein
VERIKKNPVKRSNYDALGQRTNEFIISALIRKGPKKFKTLYFDGREGFTKLRNDAKRYLLSAAKMEARYISRKLPDSIYSISVEKA